MPEDWREEPCPITVGTEAEAEERALAENEAYAGRLLRVNWLAAYTDNIRRHRRLRSDGIVRVEPGILPEGDGWRWHDGWLDPLWAVTIVEHPEAAQIPRAWIYGRGYRLGVLGPLGALAQTAWAPDYRRRE
jgi:hypothetical protein